VFARRPQAIRKLYLSESRIPALQPLLKWCVANRVGYRVVDEADLHKLAASTHHEGVVADVLREEPQALSTWLRDLPAGPQCALWLDGVGNPHNLGAILRSAAHFGVVAVLLPKHSTLALSEPPRAWPKVALKPCRWCGWAAATTLIAQLRGAGFTLAATVVKGWQRPVRHRPPRSRDLRNGRRRRGHGPRAGGSLRPAASIRGTGAVEKPQRRRGHRRAVVGLAGRALSMIATMAWRSMGVLKDPVVPRRK
jgi:TrmH RNA methyltransferase